STSDIPKGLDIRTEERAGTTRMFLAGELDLATAPRVESKLRLAQGSHHSVVVDLQDLTFMDSHGILTFIDAARRAIDAGDAFRVVNTHGTVSRVFELTHQQVLLGGQDRHRP
ncbi:MAG: STAS domain-containing protein, partial [Actinomycetota bacterium]